MLRDGRIQDHLRQITQLESQIVNLKETQHIQLEEVKAEKNAIEKEKEFLQHEQNTKELQLSDVRSKLKKRTEELSSLKDGLNSQIQQVHASFEEEGKSQTRTIEYLRQTLNQKETELQS